MKIKEIEQKYSFKFIGVSEEKDGVIYLDARKDDFLKACLALHAELGSPVKIFFADDDRGDAENFCLYCGFEDAARGKWMFVRLMVARSAPEFPSLAKEIFSANLFEKEILEMFGIIPIGNPDTRRLSLHDEIWPCGAYPLRKDFNSNSECKGEHGIYKFKKIEGVGVFEVPVGPVHAGIIGPGHFRFSVAGEPIINLEIRLGFTHKGIEKLMEGKKIYEAARLAECVTGDSSFAHSLALCNAVEKICGTICPENAELARAIFLELERMHNHIIDIGTMALDVAYSFPHAYASVMKEYLLTVNEKLTGSRYLKSVCVPGGVSKDVSGTDSIFVSGCMDEVMKDFKELKEMLLSNASFMDRVDSTGVLGRKIAEDLGVSGLVARASGIDLDLRKDFSGVYRKVKFNIAKEVSGDVLARLSIRMKEFEESANLVKQFAAMLKEGDAYRAEITEIKQGFALGYAEGWRGPVIYWVRLSSEGIIERCKIVDPSFNNWQGLAYALPGNIIPDFPLINKSFNLSYSGNDL